MSITKMSPDTTKFNLGLELPFNLRIQDFSLAMQDVYDFFFDVNTMLRGKNLERLDDTLRPANMSGMISDMLTSSLAHHSRSLASNRYHNGHPDLIAKGIYPNDAVKSGDEGIEIKTTRKMGGAVDTHGARDQWFCVWTYQIDNKTEPAKDRKPMIFTEIYLSKVVKDDFRTNERGELGTRTSTLDKTGLKKFRLNWLYRNLPHVEVSPVAVSRPLRGKRK